MTGALAQCKAPMIAMYELRCPLTQPAMSASGYKRKSSKLTGMSAFQPKADIPDAKINVRF